MIEQDNIYLGDCYELIKQVPDKSIDCIYTDIPYSIDCHGGGEWNRKGKWDGIKSPNLVNGIDYSILDEYMRVMKKTNIFIWCSKNQIIDILNHYSKFESYEILVWNKINPIPATNNRWLSDIEYCLYFRESGVRLNDGIELKSKWYTSAINMKDKSKFTHPTIKPLDLVERHIKHAVPVGGVVLDTFLGSGTTAVACKNTGRHYIGFEINEEYFKIAQDRLNDIQANGQMTMFTM